MQNNTGEDPSCKIHAMIYSCCSLALEQHYVLLNSVLLYVLTMALRSEFPSFRAEFDRTVP
jgi:hypothetical protein